MANSDFWYFVILTPKIKNNIFGGTLQQNPKFQNYQKPNICLRTSLCQPQCNILNQYNNLLPPKAKIIFYNISPGQRFWERCGSEGWDLTRAPLGYSAERAPLGGGGGRFCPPCLTSELIGAARRARRRSKALNEKVPMHFKNFLKEVTCKVKVQVKGQKYVFSDYCP